MLQIDLSKPPKKVAVLGVLGLAVILWLLVRLTGPRPDLVQPITMPRISLQDLAVKVPPKDKPGSRPVSTTGWSRDPFALPYSIVLQSGLETEETGSQGEGAERPLPNLTAILISGSRRLAVINNLVVGVGDWVHGERVVKISSDRVILTGPEGSRELRVPPPQTAIGSRPVRGEFDRW